MAQSSQGPTLWFTGLPCSGKTSIAQLVTGAVAVQDQPVEWLDGDELRKHFSAGMTFSKADRTAHLTRVAYLCKMLNKHGVIVLASFISPFREHRDIARRIIGESYVEIFIDTPLDECIARDDKGMYKQAIAGTLKQFTGISDPYEPPTAPDLVIHTVQETPQQSAQQVLDFLHSQLTTRA